MKYKSAYCVGMIIFVWMSAALGGEETKCENIQDSQGVLGCSKDEKNEADNKLNDSYQLLKARIGSQFERDRRLGEKYLMEVKQSQLAWMNLRDKNCALEAFEIERGSQPYESVINKCVARMSNERSGYLNGIAPLL